MKGPLAFLAKRYIAGPEREDALRAALALNKNGVGAIIDNLGENVINTSEAEESVKEYLELLDDIRRADADSTISLKLTHIGLDLSREIALRNAEIILKKALALGNSVRFDITILPPELLSAQPCICPPNRSAPSVSMTGLISTRLV